MKNTDYTTIACVALGALAAVGLGYMFSDAYAKQAAKENEQDHDFLSYVMGELLRQSQSCRVLLSPMPRSVVSAHLLLATELYNINHDTNYAVPDFTVHSARPTPDLKQVVIKVRRTECKGMVYCY